jgi:hypothetical protein
MTFTDAGNRIGDAESQIGDAESQIPEDGHLKRYF